MSQTKLPEPHGALSSTQPERLKIGTLTYTKASLITLFLFLLWGDFCFSLMEIVVPSIMPLKLNAIGAPNWVLGLILTTIPNVMNTIVNPFVSFRSDRFRSKWGRRIPFLAGPTPFVTVFLILLAYSEPISRFIHHSFIFGRGSDFVVLVVTISVFMVCFQFFNLFIMSVYYYLFNDVVPEAFLARFMALFRVVGTCAGGLYNFFIFKHAETHMQEIFLAVGILYLFAFALMCWKVKEGEYPPPPVNVDHQKGFISAVKTYACECFTHRLYWYFFLALSCQSMTWVGGGFTSLVQTKVLGFDLSFIGKVGGVCSFISMALLYPAGILSDRFHPLRVLLVINTISLSIAPLGMCFVFFRNHLSLETAMAISIAFAAISVPLGTLAAASELPIYMKLLPRERYGQFCSAASLVRSCILIIGGTGCGAFLDLMKRFGTTPDDCYRFVSVWNAVFAAGYLGFLYLLYRQWQLHGGLTAYTPPGSNSNA